jgi:hypothetical protein
MFSVAYGDQPKRGWVRKKGEPVRLPKSFVRVRHTRGWPGLPANVQAYYSRYLGRINGEAIPPIITTPGLLRSSINTMEFAMNSHILSLMEYTCALDDAIPTMHTGWYVGGMQESET